MKDRVKLRFDGCVVEGTLVEKPVGYDNDGRRICHWAVICDAPIEFDEHSIPKVEVQRCDVWIECCSVRIPSKGGSKNMHVSFPDPE